MQFGQELWLFLNVHSLKKRLSLLTGGRTHWRMISGGVCTCMNLTDGLQILPPPAENTSSLGSSSVLSLTNSPLNCSNECIVWFSCYCSNWFQWENAVTFHIKGQLRNNSLFFFKFNILCWYNVNKANVSLKLKIIINWNIKKPDIGEYRTGNI